MSRYVTRLGYWDSQVGEVYQPEHVTVHEGDGLIDTGLLNATGDPIYRSEREPMGFDISPRRRVRIKARGRRQDA